MARELTLLRSFVDWLGDERGFIGEWGHPSRPGEQCTGLYATPVTYSVDDVLRWTTLGERYLREMETLELWGAWWAAGAFPDDYNKLSHLMDGPITATPAGAYLEQGSHPANGVTLAGGEWSGEYPDRASFRYLRDNGITLVRLPFAWERLDGDGLLDLLDTVHVAQAYGLNVILNLHNYGSPDYWTSEQPRRMTTEEFVEIWVRLSDHFHDVPAVVGYGLMNEPNSEAMRFTDPQEGADYWMEASQAVVTALRNRGDQTRIFVSGWEFAKIQNFLRFTPEPWIADPADNTWYEAHHYFDAQGETSSTYDSPYDTYLRKAEGEGYESFTERAPSLPFDDLAAQARQMEVTSHGRCTYGTSTDE